MANEKPSEPRDEFCQFLGDGKTARTRCSRPAIVRSARDARCEFHTGHLDFTERKIDGIWIPWIPLHSPLHRANWTTAKDWRAYVAKENSSDQPQGVLVFAKSAGGD